MSRNTKTSQNVAKTVAVHGWMSPVSDEAPCGVDLEYDPEFVVLGAKVVWQWVENPYWVRRETGKA